MKVETYVRCPECGGCAVASQEVNGAGILANIAKEHPELISMADPTVPPPPATYPTWECECGWSAPRSADWGDMTVREALELARQKEMDAACVQVEDHAWTILLNGKWAINAVNALHRWLDVGTPMDPSTARMLDSLKAAYVRSPRGFVSDRMRARVTADVEAWVRANCPDAPRPRKSETVH